MTKREKHEIACTVRAIMEDSCDEIRTPYEKLNGSLKGLRKHVRKECVEFWTNHEPYLPEEDMGADYMYVGNRIINIDDCWCFIRDGLKSDIEHV